METGKVTIDAMTDAHDCGFAINRTNVEGQMQGSLSMGLGEALFEEVKFDENGRVCNASLGEYRIPTPLDMPNVKTIIIESNEPNGPFGAKEVGEGAIMPTIPAILNAIYDATGVRINELPVTSERLYNAMKLKCQIGGSHVGPLHTKLGYKPWERIRIFTVHRRRIPSRDGGYGPRTGRRLLC